MAAETGPEGSDVSDYRSAAFCLALRDPLRRAEALAHLDQHFERLAYTYIPSRRLGGSLSTTTGHPM